MKPETIAKARTMLASVLQDGLSYREAGAPFGLARSTVERSIKGLVQAVARERGIPELDEDGLSCLRQFREPVQRAVAEYTPAPPRRKCITLLEPDEIAAGANRVRLRSENANRDVALIYVLFCTGAKPIEIARLEVRDYLNHDGSIRQRSEMRAETAVNGRSRPLFFTSTRSCSAVDAYLVERRRRKLGVVAVAGLRATDADAYRGLDPASTLFLTEGGWPFEIGRRGPNDERETCRLMIATLRLIFQRAGWTGVTAQSARRVVARRLADKGADCEQVGEILGLSSSRAVRRLLTSKRRPLENLARELV
jgi:integrase